MKCNAKKLSQLSPSERKKLSSEIRKYNEDFLREQCTILKKEITNNIFKLMVITANESLGLGSKRIEKMLVNMEQLIVKCDDNDNFWLQNDSLCKRILTEPVYYKYFTDYKFILFNKEE